MLIDNIMSTNIIYNCNAKRSPFDKRDYIIKNNRNCPDALDLRHELLPVRNQGEQGTCYAQSAACAKEWQEKRDYDLDEYLSPQFFYNNRNNKYDDQRDNDEGMFGNESLMNMYLAGQQADEASPFTSRVQDVNNNTLVMKMMETEEGTNEIINIAVQGLAGVQAGIINRGKNEYEKHNKSQNPTAGMSFEEKYNFYKKGKA